MPRKQEAVGSVEGKWYCDMALKPCWWKRDKKHGIGRVCNTEVASQHAPCPNDHKHQ